MDHQAFAQLLGNYGEFFGAIAVVATLIYLAVQIRQNSMQLRIASHQASLDRHSGLIANVLDNPGNFGWFRDGLESYHALNSEQKAQFHVHIYRHIDAYRHSLLLNQKGAMSDEELGELTLNIARVLKCPGAEEWRDSLVLEPSAREFWDGIASDILEAGKDALPINKVLPFLSKQADTIVAS